MGDAVRPMGVASEGDGDTSPSRFGVKAFRPPVRGVPFHSNILSLCRFENAVPGRLWRWAGRKRMGKDGHARIGRHDKGFFEPYPLRGMTEEVRCPFGGTACWHKPYLCAEERPYRARVPTGGTGIMAYKSRYTNPRLEKRNDVVLCIVLSARVGIEVNVEVICRPCAGVKSGVVMHMMCAFWWRPRGYPWRD